ncbi:uncharacterized protein LY89DRAFT_741641 [Mollisia scopiformis]|uniref:Uncharacterized protein n=1 Tax=Mollisia scopiformis TaxID=149040 RepID=A0A132BAC0_MOLSC|nr:uncharacterized protein LY89DRAFT_741641 [Mollisia scopiformis]KUJ08804.1 hypothetical protein LY89DRAFT_741641 [Mollisia scopiformis]
MPNSFFTQLGALAVIGYIVLRYLSPTRRTLSLGPNQLSILANVKDLPPPDVLESQHWLKHKDLHGPISSVTVLGMTLVLIHDKKVAHGLLEENASETSGRLSMVFTNQMCGFEYIVLCQGYNSTFRHHRKLLREFGIKVSAAQFRDIQEVEVNRQLVHALNEPGKLLEHYRTQVRIFGK